MPARHYTHTRRATFIRKDRRSNADAAADAPATLMTTTLAAALPQSSTEHDVHVHVQHGTEESGQDAAEEAGGKAADKDEDENDVADRLMARCLMAAGYALAVRYALPSGGHMASLAESGFARVCFDGAPWPSASPEYPGTQGASHARGPTEPGRAACVMIDGSFPVEGSFQVYHPSSTAKEAGTLQCELTVTTRPDRPPDWEQWNGETGWIHHLSGELPPSVLSFRRPLVGHHSHSEELFISVSAPGEHDVDVVFGAESRQDKDEAWMIQEPQGWSARLRCDRSGDVGQVEDGEQDSEAATEQ